MPVSSQLRISSKVKGYILGAIAAATYGTNPLFTLPLYADGMDAYNVLFFRYLFAIPAVALMLIWRRRGFRIEPRTVWPLTAMGILVALSSLLLFLSYNYMDAGIASTLLFVYPLMVAVIMAVFFKECLTFMTVMCILLALTGIGLLFKGADGIMLSITGTVFVMFSSLCYAGYIIGVNRPGLKRIPTLKVILYVLITGAALFACKITASPNSHFIVPDKWYMWCNIVALALLPTVISFICTTKAIQYIGPTPTAILGALEPVTAVIIGVSIFGEVLTPRDIAGLILIIFAVSLVVAGGKITAPLIRFRRLFPSLRGKHNQKK